MAVINHISTKKKSARVAQDRREQVRNDPDTLSLLAMPPEELDAYIDGLTNFTEVRDLVKQLAKITLAK